MRKAGPPISSKGFLRVITSQRMIPQLNTSHFSLYRRTQSNTSVLYTRGEEAAFDTADRLDEELTDGVKAAINIISDLFWGLRPAYGSGARRSTGSRIRVLRCQRHEDIEPRHSKVTFASRGCQEGG
ncbi:hypothetical protein EYF80_020591 [Liparis tanakae]|uniref:Uncharacterized protein n=1 Tax=Liparis tanakae TaxID=230148 RepID=A0A4Z2HVT5_9TELE|nr:hypothetical protein EYF80_020591 [Liparis tanakae]